METLSGAEICGTKIKVYKLFLTFLVAFLTSPYIQVVEAEEQVKSDGPKNDSDDGSRKRMRHN